VAALRHRRRQGPHQEERRDCTLGSLAGELSPTDEASREDLNQGFLRWQALLRDGLHTMRSRGELQPAADLDELSLALLTAPQGGTILGRTMRDTRPLRAAMNAALAYIRSFAPPATTVKDRT
jgi:hypothetical protein